MEGIHQSVLNQEMIEYVDMKHYKIPYVRIGSFLSAMLVVANLALFSSCRKDIDERIKECYNANDTIINLSDLYPEEWDTVYYFTNACNLDDVEKRVGPVIRRLYGDIGDRILILNKKEKVKDNSHLNEVVCYKEYFPNYGQKNEGSVFVFRNRPPIVAIPREKANFLIRKIDDNTFWVIHHEEETQKDSLDSK